MSRPKRKRITPDQLEILSALFEYTDTPTFNLREAIGNELGMTNREVQVWFQNRRAKFNRQRLTNPQATRSSLHPNPVSLAILTSSNLLRHVHLDHQPHLRDHNQLPHQNQHRICSSSVPPVPPNHVTLPPPKQPECELKRLDGNQSLNLVRSPDPYKPVELSHGSDLALIPRSPIPTDAPRSSRLSPPADQPYSPKSHLGDHTDSRNSSASSIHSLLVRTSSPSGSSSISAHPRPPLPEHGFQSGYVPSDPTGRQHSNSNCSSITSSGTNGYSCHPSNSSLTTPSSLSPSWSIAAEEFMDSAAANPSSSSQSSAGPSTPRNHQKLSETAEDYTSGSHSVPTYRAPLWGSTRTSSSLPPYPKRHQTIPSVDRASHSVATGISFDDRNSSHHKISEAGLDDNICFQMEAERQQTFCPYSRGSNQNYETALSGGPSSIHKLLCSNSGPARGPDDGRAGATDCLRSMGEGDRSGKRSLFESRSLPPLPLSTQAGTGSFPVLRPICSPRYEPGFNPPGTDPQLRLPPLKF